MHVTFHYYVDRITVSICDKVTACLLPVIGHITPAAFKIPLLKSEHDLKFEGTK